MNELAYVIQAWLPLIVWQQVDAPEYRKGFITVTCLSVTLIITTVVIRHLDLKEKSQKRYVPPICQIVRCSSDSGPGKISSKAPLTILPTRLQSFQ